MLTLDDQDYVAEAGARLGVFSLTDSELLADLRVAVQPDVATGYFRDWATAVALGEEMTRRRATRSIAGSDPCPLGPIHEGGWAAPQSLEFFRRFRIRGRLIGARGMHGLELREYTCLTRCIDDSVVEFPHRIVAKAAHHYL